MSRWNPQRPVTGTHAGGLRGCRPQVSARDYVSYSNGYCGLVLGVFHDCLICNLLHQFMQETTTPPTYFLGKNSEADQPPFGRYLQLRFDPAGLSQAKLFMHHPHHHDIRKLSCSTLGRSHLDYHKCQGYLTNRKKACLRNNSTSVLRKGQFAYK